MKLSSFVFKSVLFYRKTKNLFFEIFRDQMFVFTKHEIDEFLLRTVFSITADLFFFFASYQIFCLKRYHRFGGIESLKKQTGNDRTILTVLSMKHRVNKLKADGG